MADLVRIKPVNPAYGGDDVETGLNNDNTDIKNIYAIVTKLRGNYYGLTPPQQPNLGDQWTNSADNLDYWWDGDSWEKKPSIATGGHAETADTATNAANAAKLDNHLLGNDADEVLLLNSNGKVPTANLPIATTTTIGAVKVGEGINVDQNGVISVPKIVVNTGIIRNGETIPLPDGFTAEQCKWFVIPTRIQNADGGDLYEFTCSVDANRLVTLKSEGVTTTNYGTYVIIGIK